ncbi:hypothetical protein CMI45_00485 [Candidatus Pacearchaeota archaeon]|nr:hypothetical protein [Candidatus Pacearchaeota archaeon]
MSLSVSVSAFLVDECPAELDGNSCGIVEDDGEISKGTCYNQQCLKFEKTKIVYDPSYVEETKDDRLFDLRKQKIEMNPFDDLLCVVALTSPPGDSGKADLKGRFYTYEGEGDDRVKVVLKEGSFDHMFEDSYKFEAKGYDGGAFPSIAESDEDLEKLVKSGRLGCELVTDDGKVFENPKTRVEKETSSCVRLWGPDRLYGLPKYVSDYAITSMRGSSSRFNAKEIVRRGKRDMIEGYQEVDPFGSDEPVIGLKEPSYKELFKYYVDLQNYNDGDWEVVDRHFGRKAFSFVSRNSNCPTARIHNFYNLRG